MQIELFTPDLAQTGDCQNRPKAQLPLISTSLREHEALPRDIREGSVMPTVTASGLRVSSTKTSQAQEDYVVTYENVATTVDVLANDNGGNASSLYSLSQTYSLTQEFTSLSTLGALISISNGLVLYDPTAAGAIQSLVLGQQMEDTFLYWERLGNGTLSSATVHVTVRGLGAPLTGKVADGYISGATVFIDSNGNGVFDQGIDPSAVTDGSGNFTLATAMRGPLIAYGGTNIDTGLANTLTLTAPEGATVINPLTTLIETLVADGMAIADAETIVQYAFPISFTTSGDPDLLSYDPLAINDAQSLSLQKIMVEIATILKIGMAAGATEGAIMDALASMVAAHPYSSSDLTSQAIVTDIFAAAGLGTLSVLLADETVRVNELIALAPTFADISAVQQTGEPPAGSVQTSLGHHFVDASGDMTIYLSAGSDTVHFADGGNYIVWGLDSLDQLNFAELFPTIADSSGDFFTNVSNFQSEFANGSIGHEGVDENGTPFVFLDFSADGAVTSHAVAPTTIKIMGCTVEQLNNIMFGSSPYFGMTGSNWFSGDALQFAVQSLDVSASGTLVQTGAGTDIIDVHGANNVIDISAGGTDTLHIYAESGTSIVWGFSLNGEDVLDVTATAAGAGGWSQFAAAVENTGHEGTDANGTVFFEFDLGNAHIQMMGLTASQFAQLETNHSLFGF